MEVPHSFFEEHPCFRLCLACPGDFPRLFVSIGKKPKSICADCRKLDRSAREAGSFEGGESKLRSAKTGLPKPLHTPSILDLPSLDELFAAPPTSALRVPAPLRARWADTYAKLMNEARYLSDYRHWILLLMFEKVGLAAQPRGGKRAKGYLSRQLDQWDADPVALWRKLNPKEGARPARKPNNSPAARGKRAVDAARQGLAARAVAALDSGALAPPADPNRRIIISRPYN